MPVYVCSYRWRETLQTAISTKCNTNQKYFKYQQYQQMKSLHTCFKVKNFDLDSGQCIFLPVTLDLCTCRTSPLSMTSCNFTLVLVCHHCYIVITSPYFVFRTDFTFKCTQTRFTINGIISIRFSCRPLKKKLFYFNLIYTTRKRTLCTHHFTQQWQITKQVIKILPLIFHISKLSSIKIGIILKV